jgi:hypothetical protein
MLQWCYTSLHGNDDTDITTFPSTPRPANNIHFQHVGPNQTIHRPTTFPVELGRLMCAIILDYSVLIGAAAEETIHQCWER